MTLSKTQIDALGNRLKQGATTDADLRLLDAFRRSFAPAYEHVIRTVERVVTADVSGRPAKSTGAIVEKLQRESIRLTQMQDIAGCRFVVPDIAAQNAATHTLLGALGDVTLIDRRERPSHGYRAVHLVVVVEGKPVEIQNRTELQHLWAGFSEKAADVYNDPGIKYGSGPPLVMRFLEAHSDYLAMVESAELDAALMPNPELEQDKRALRGQLEELTRRFGAARK